MLACIRPLEGEREKEKTEQGGSVRENKTRLRFILFGLD